MGIANIISRISLGIVADRPWVNKLYLYAVSVIVSGIVTICTPFCERFETLMVISVLHGIFQGLLMVLMSLLVADIVWVEKHSQGFGLLNCFAGVATIVGPPLAGWMYDLTGNYYLTFYVENWCAKARKHMSR